MAELRHTVASGKMNKDLDERIVPQGEYRDALNIEIRTSGDSDVGALQNLYGTKGRVTYSSDYGDVNPTINWTNTVSCHVGSIANEKTNKAYFFIASPPVNEPRKNDGFDFSDITGAKLYKDMIVEYDNITRGISPVAIDVWRVEVGISNIGTITDSNSTVNGSATVPYRYINVSGFGADDNIGFNIRPGMTFSAMNASGNPITSSYKIHEMGGDNGLGHPKVLKTEAKDDGSIDIHFDRFIIGSLSTTHCFTFSASKTLNFSTYNYKGKKNYITGINIIDDLLFWTDNKTEPKKVNITRSVEGCVGFDYHTTLMINNPNSFTPSLQSLNSVDTGTDGGIVESHLSVIRRAPRTSPKLEMSKHIGGVENSEHSSLLSWAPGMADNGWQEDWFTTSFVVNNEVMQPGDQIKIATQEGFHYNTGDRLKIYNVNHDREVVVVITENTYNPSIHFYNAEIDTINHEITSSDIVWKVKLFEFEKEPYFQLKFGRFSFRYKYQDGEYSSFAPWSELAFIPSKFDYVPKKGYNLGMVNNTRMLKVTDFIVDDALRPDDVTEVDILYKDTVSPNVYIVKTIKRSKNHEWSERGIGSYKGVINITSEMIHRTLESSQTLRAWDNVPRKALAQEVTGNRIVYGNYLQNYNINKPVFVKQWYESWQHSNSPRSLGPRAAAATAGDDATSSIGFYEPKKSLKSIRKYRIGVVFGDKYGRETPVIGLGGMEEQVGNLKPNYWPDSVNVPKEKCASVNRLKAQLDWKGTTPENWMEYYKFYVKETTNEYYNMVQSSWYYAEDGNIWLSFQSSDRNKVDIETYLILKNGHGTEEPVLTKARYKILAIKNEAPDFIKTTNKILGCAPMESDIDLSDSMIVNFTTENYKHFKNIEFKGVGYGRLRAIEGEDIRYSEWVKIARLNDELETITLVDPFGDSAEFAQGLGVSNYADIDEYEFEVKDAVVENRPEFDGKFFVKILRDATLSAKILDETEDGFSYNVVGQLRHGYVKNDCINSLPTDSATYRGDFSGIADDSVSTGSADSQGGQDFTGDRWGENGVTPGGLSSGCSGTDTAGAMGNCGSKDRTRNFWQWYRDDSPSKGLPYIDHARGAGKDGSANTWGSGPQNDPNDPVAEWHPGLHKKPGVSGYSAIQWGAMGRDAFYNQNVDFYNKMIEEGKLFRFSGDPTKTVYEISGSESPYHLWNYHKEIVGVCKECDDDSDACLRHVFRMFFHKKNEPEVGMDVNEWDVRSSLAHDGATTAVIEFVEAHFDRAEAVEIKTGNAIWETEPKEDVGMDLYYEATDAIPTYLKNENIQSFIPLLSDVRIRRNGQYLTTPGFDILRVRSAVKDVVSIGSGVVNSLVDNLGIKVGDILEFTHLNGTVTETEVIAHWHPYEDYSSSVYKPSNGWNSESKMDETGYYRLNHNLYHRPMILSWFNCYSFGNGLESDRIRDDFNAPTIDNGVKVSTTLDTFGEEHRASGMIWSGIYNSTSGVNNLNEFNMANPITKDLNPSYGSLQALKTRDTNMVAFCEDKVFKILANKDALYNADGSSNVTASNAVLGDAKAFVGDYGISSNPESLAVDSYRMYFTDKQRNKVLRLSQDGMTPISDVGMISWFRDNLDTTKHLIGTFDEIKGEYNLSLVREPGHIDQDITVSWSEQTKGWSSFKSFVPETGLSINDEYLTGKIIYNSSNTSNINNKPLWSHHNEDTVTDVDGTSRLEVSANSFYGTYYNSTINVVFNQSPEVVKSFQSMSYEGTQAKVDGWDSKEITDVNGNATTYNNTNYQGLENDTTEGWYVSSFKTNLQEASVPEFKNKEGKWFEYIKGDSTTLSNLDTKEFSVQGISLIDIVSKPLVKTYTLTITENGE